ncbi:MAG: membrane protein [Cyanobium sp. CACIAM 14]|nr:MAG: membrane protein [Cyanobium sp. CACIAM 14]
MPELLYRSLVWLDVRLGILFAVGVPLVLLVWAALRREQALVRLLLLYWKVASLQMIALLLLTGNRPTGFLLLVLAPLLVVATLWFWVDLNEELADMPPWRALPLTLRIWRWSLTLLSLAAASLAVTALPCMSGGATPGLCRVWLEAPQGLHGVVARVFAFVFGGDWTPGVAAFVGYAALVGYVVGLLQWLVVRLPRLGRVAGEF